MRTLVATEAFGKALCSPQVAKVKPKRILDLACGTGLWSALCSDYLKELGFEDVEFVGMDIAPTAPNLSRQGVKWKFVQHDNRIRPYPFEDGYFDLVMIKDSTMIMPLDERSYGALDEILRTLRIGGIMEVWESDHVIRSLHPDTPPPPAGSVEDQLIAEATATFCVPRGHPFLPTSNKYFTQANKWVAEALDWESMMAAPCTRIAEMLTQEETLSDHGSRRIAIPFGELKNEQEGSDSTSVASSRRYNDSMMSAGSREKATWPERTLTADQIALRHTALLTNLQMYQSMEPLLRKASGKTADEWASWWANMMTEMLGPNKPDFAGECLEIGVFWATKVRDT
jgi:ubiquinone/menaquinone biosynthesis C-methylase UbiE